MSTTKLKLLAWTSAGILAALMSGYVFLFFQGGKDVRAGVTQDEMRGVLNQVSAIEETATQKVSYDRIKGSVIELNWTGYVPPAPVEGAGPAQPVEVQARPVAELVRVTMIVGDADSPEKSFCHLIFLPEAKIPPALLENPTLGVRFVGEKLPAPIDYIRVEQIGPGGVTFAFDDAERAPESLLPATFEMLGGIVAIEGGGLAQRQQPRIQIPRTEGGQPRKTYEYKPGHYRVGTEDAAYIAENYSEILSREVRTTKHRDPRTGKYDGIEVRSIAQGSLAGNHGIQEGDVIKSINGHEVTTVSQALQYVKANAHLYDTWEVVVSNMGLDRTVTYNSPE